MIRIVLLTSCLLFVGCSSDRYNYEVVTEDQLRPSMEEGSLEPGRSYTFRGKFYEMDGVRYVGDADGPIIRFEVHGDEFDRCINDFGGNDVWTEVAGVYEGEGVMGEVDVLDSPNHTLLEACIRAEVRDRLIGNMTAGSR